MSERIYLIGHPLGYSWSPAMQQAALVYYGLSATYHLLDVAPLELPQALKYLRGPRVLGFNVTMPHKETIIAMLDWVDSDAWQLGAVNTVINKAGRLLGYNTDVHGASETLQGLGSASIRVTLLGAGGAARAVVMALANSRLRLASLTVVNRSDERAQGLKALGERVGIDIAAIGVSELEKVLLTTDLLINCATDSSIALECSFTCKVWDLNYGSKAQSLRDHCSRLGVPYQDGSQMLLHQGAKAFELWTSRKAPIAVMAEALPGEGSGYA